MDAFRQRSSTKVGWEGDEDEGEEGEEDEDEGDADEGGEMMHTSSKDYTVLVPRRVFSFVHISL